MTTKVSLDELLDLATRALIVANTSCETARVVANALVAADADGLSSHGVSRVPFYADQVLSGKVDGQAEPQLQLTAGSAVHVDAKDGFAFPAIKLGIERALTLVEDAGIVGVGIANSHHCGAGSYHVEPVAERGYVAVGFSNTPSGMAPCGGFKGTLGTNPIAFACPREHARPLVIDLSLSKVARGKVMLAEKKGESIPDDWALDAEGKPTTDPSAALAGTMVPIGDAKGAALALMVEILAAGLTGSNFAFQASSFFTAQGPPPRIGQFFIMIDPAKFNRDGFSAHVEQLTQEILGQKGARLPGDRRLALREKSKREGVAIADELYQELVRRTRQNVSGQR
ncbi:MAG: Ldh family oxidoreductase [Acidiferrobacterales bacterium]